MGSDTTPMAESLLDQMAKAIYRQSLGALTGLPFDALGELQKEVYRGDARAAVKVLACWLDDQEDKGKVYSALSELLAGLASLPRYRPTKPAGPIQS